MSTENQNKDEFDDIFAEFDKPIDDPSFFEIETDGTLEIGEVGELKLGSKTSTYTPLQFKGSHWTPKLGAQGNIHYYAQAGDTLDTFRRQYKLEQAAINRLKRELSITDADIQRIKGFYLSGRFIEELLEDAPGGLLKLDLASLGVVNDQVVLDHMLFALEHAAKWGNTYGFEKGTGENAGKLVKREKVLDPHKYFQNITSHIGKGTGSGTSAKGGAAGNVSGKGFMLAYDGLKKDGYPRFKKIEVEYSFQLGYIMTYSGKDTTPYIATTPIGLSEKFLKKDKKRYQNMTYQLYNREQRLFMKGLSATSVIVESKEAAASQVYAHLQNIEKGGESAPEDKKIYGMTQDGVIFTKNPQNYQKYPRKLLNQTDFVEIIDWGLQESFNLSTSSYHFVKVRVINGKYKDEEAWVSNIFLIRVK